MKTRVEVQPPVATPVGEIFSQTLVLMRDNTPIGRATWHTIGDGVVQILNIHIDEPHQRQNHGSELLHALYDQVRVFHRARKTPPRRAYITVQQAGHLKCRAFLTRHGFHHTATIKHLFNGQDAMIYQRGFD